MGVPVTFCCLFFLSFFLNPHLKICFSLDFRERNGERERERNIDVRKKHILVASHMCPDWGSNLQPFGVRGQHSNLPSTWSMAVASFLELGRLRGGGPDVEGLGGSLGSLSGKRNSTS